MDEERTIMKTCPSCSKEVPAHWGVCEFCGNVFRKAESVSEPPGMLSWNRGCAGKKN